MFFLTVKQYPVRFPPTPSNCNLQVRTGFRADPEIGTTDRFQQSHVCQQPEPGAWV